MTSNDYPRCFDRLTTIEKETAHSSTDSNVPPTLALQCDMMEKECRFGSGVSDVTIYWPDTQLRYNRLLSTYPQPLTDETLNAVNHTMRGRVLRHLQSMPPTSSTAASVSKPSSESNLKSRSSSHPGTDVTGACDDLTPRIMSGRIFHDLECFLRDHICALRHRSRTSPVFKWKGASMNDRMSPFLRQQYHKLQSELSGLDHQYEVMYDSWMKFRKQLDQTRANISAIGRTIKDHRQEEANATAAADALVSVGAVSSSSTEESMMDSVLDEWQPFSTKTIKLPTRSHQILPSQLPLPTTITTASLSPSAKSLRESRSIPSNGIIANADGDGAVRAQVVPSDRRRTTTKAPLNIPSAVAPATNPVTTPSARSKVRSIHLFPCGRTDCRATKAVVTDPSTGIEVHEACAFVGHELKGSNGIRFLVHWAGFKADSSQWYTKTALERNSSQMFQQLNDKYRGMLTESELTQQLFQLTPEEFRQRRQRPSSVLPTALHSAATAAAAVPPLKPVSRPKRRRETAPVSSTASTDQSESDGSASLDSSSSLDTLDSTEGSDSSQLSATTANPHKRSKRAPVRRSGGGDGDDEDETMTVSTVVAATTDA